MNFVENEIDNKNYKFKINNGNNNNIIHNFVRKCNKNINQPINDMILKLYYKSSYLDYYNYKSYTYEDSKEEQNVCIKNIISHKLLYNKIKDNNYIFTKK